MDAGKYKLKADKYRKARGGYSRFLNIYCSKCKTHLFLYQKDGPGPLKRAYMDRILAPQELTEKQSYDTKSVGDMSCPKCGLVIGTPYVYQKEKRKAFLLNPLSFKKDLTKGIYPPESR